MRNEPKSRRPSASSAHPRPPKFPVVDPIELVRYLNKYAIDPLPHRCLPNPSSAAVPTKISQLPPELLAEIFCYALPSDPFPVPSRTEAPLQLAQTSSSWRSLALSTPTLWSALHINYKDPQEDIPAARLWLSRSASLPLHLSLAVDFNDQPQKAILDFVCEYAPRWYSVRFDFRHLCCPPMYDLNRALERTSNLHAFEFHARDLTCANVAPITHLLSSSPAVKEVAWVDDLADMDTILALPLSRLSRLSLAMDHGTLDYLQVLHHCANLEHICISRPLAPMHTPLGPLHLNKLTSLSISWDLTPLLHHLVLPALCHVQIQNEKPTSSHVYAGTIGMGAGTWDPVELLDLVDRSGCDVHSLSLKAPMDQTAVLACLQKTSDSLRSLSIRGSWAVPGVVLGDEVLQALTHQDDVEETLCPHLEEMLLDARLSACSPGMLTHLVESRLALPPPYVKLRKLHIQEGHRELDRIRERVGLMNKGFGLEVIPRRNRRNGGKIGMANWFFKRKLCASR